MNKRPFYYILLFIVVCVAICSIPLHLPHPGNNTIRIFLGTNKGEAYYTVEPETEEFTRVCNGLEQLRYHFSPRAGIELTAPQTSDSPLLYAFLIYQTDNGKYSYLSVSEKGFLSKDNQSYAIGHLGDDKASKWLAELGQALETVEPKSIEKS